MQSLSELSDGDGGYRRHQPAGGLKPKSNGRQMLRAVLYPSDEPTDGTVDVILRISVVGITE